MGSLTVQEIGGHFLFGFIPGLPFRKLRLAVLCGLMALAVDADHLLNVAGFEVQGRVSHSIPFMVIASIMIGFIVNSNATCSIQGNTKQIATRSRRTPKGANFIDDSRSHLQNTHMLNIFSQFLVITAAAVISHIAFDTYVDNHAYFPLLVPFVYTEFYIS
jgi:NO-binding membrane sensor protein with MHYT domain